MLKFIPNRRPCKPAQPPYVDHTIQILHRQVWTGLKSHLTGALNISDERIYWQPRFFLKRTEMIKEVLDVMINLAKEGITMLCVTHEMGFACEVADEIIFMDFGKIVERGTYEEFFNNPKSERAREFLKQIL